MKRLTRLALSLAVPPGSSLAAFLATLPADCNPFVDDLEQVLHTAGPFPRRGLARLRQSCERSLELADKTLQHCAAEGVSLLLPGDPDWPEVFKALYAPPLALYLKGERSLISSPMTTIVGTRFPTSRGRVLAAELAAILVSQNQCIVSGGAYGIDSAAHAGALEAGGRTLAVLGGGLDRLYPAHNRLLFKRIVEHGALVSEYPPGTPATAWRFPLRNRILAALGKELIVVQAPVRSGTQITVSEALAIGKDVHVCLWPPECQAGAGCLRWAGLGAGVIIDGSELLGTEADYSQLVMPLSVDSGERILAALRCGCLSLDALVDTCRMPVEEVMTLCTRLELEGAIRRFGSEGYGLARSA